MNVVDAEGERVVHFVSDARDQLAYRGHFRRMNELSLSAAKLVVRLSHLLGAGQRQGPWNQWPEQDGCDEGDDRGHELDEAGQPIARNPQRIDSHQVSGATGENKSREGHKHPVESKVFPLCHEGSKCQGDGKIGGRDDGVGAHMKSDQHGIPEVTVAVWHEVDIGEHHYMTLPFRLEDGIRAHS